MNHGQMPAPDVPALMIIGLVMLWLPPAMEWISRWTSDAGPVRVVFLGW